MVYNKAVRSFKDALDAKAKPPSYADLCEKAALCEMDGQWPSPTEAVHTVRAADIGVARPITDSDGAVYSLPQMTARQAERLRRLGQNLARKTRGSANRRRAVQALNRFQAKLRRRRQDARRKAVVRLFTGVDAVALEDLNVKGMTASVSLSKPPLQGEVIDTSLGTLGQPWRLPEAPSECRPTPAVPGLPAS